MPPQIGDIISELVYEGNLRSNPLHPITEETTACYFIEALGSEKPLPSGSFMVFNCSLVFLEQYLSFVFRMRLKLPISST